MPPTNRKERLLDWFFLAPFIIGSLIARLGG